MPPTLAAPLPALDDWPPVPCSLDPDAWFGDRDDPVTAKAIAACRRCPALTRCRDLARQARPTHGVWGGRFYGRRERERPTSAA